MPDEAQIMARHFLRPGAGPDDPAVVTGIGDDAAVIEVPPGRQLVTSTDTLLDGVHFLSTAATPGDVGHKALAVNLSDLAAMGAAARWFTLSLTLPDYSPEWLAAFAEGLFALADRYAVQLIGGDLSRGPLSVTVQAYGLVPAGAALRRSGARPGDGVYVSGQLGAAGRALALLQQGRGPEALPEQDWARLHRPLPRLEEAAALRGIASSMIDLSDGLAADLATLLDCSGVGAGIELARLPLADCLQTLPAEEAWRMALCSGDDYELCFTAPPGRDKRVRAPGASCALTRIGRVTADPQLRWLRDDGAPWRPRCRGYQHF